MRRLTPHDRALLRHLFNDGVASYVDIGRAVGMPVGSIGPTRGRILARMRALEPVAELI